MADFNGGTIGGNIYPSSTGLDLGSSSQRWDLFAQSIDVSSSATLASLVGGSLLPTRDASNGHPAIPAGQDTIFNSDYLTETWYETINLTGHTFGTGADSAYTPFARLQILSGNPTLGAGNRQWVGYFRGMETSSTAGDLANVADIKLANNYFSLRAPDFTGTMEGTEDDVYYRAAGTIDSLQYGHSTSCGVPDAIAANITNTSYCRPAEFFQSGSGAVGGVVVDDVRPIINMALGGTLAGMTGYCFGCVSTISSTGTVTQNVYGFQANAPATLPTFSAGKYWFSGLVHNNSTGANVNNWWFDGGTYNSGHFVFGGNGGSTATHLWVKSGGLPRITVGAAPGSDSAGFQMLSGEHQRFGATCSTAASAGASCTTAYTWTTAFADTNYTVTCSGVAVAAGVPALSIDGISTTQVTVRVTAITAAAAGFTNVYCIAAHD